MDGCSRHCKLFCIIRVWEVEDESKGEEIRGSIGVCVIDRIQSHDIRGEVVGESGARVLYNSLDT